jgi:hypothetical protein
MQKHHRTGLAGGLLGFLVGAVVSGTAVEAFLHPGDSISSSRPAAEPMRRGAGPSEIRPLPQRVILRVVTEEETAVALDSMGLNKDEQLLIRGDLEARKYRLLWLTIWDWDAQGEHDGDTISIKSDDYRRAIRLINRRQLIAIPEPRSGFIELRGERSQDDIIAISLLSGAQPLALPRMAIGQPISIEIDTP